MISAVVNEYKINSIKDYIELINSIIDDVLNDKYSIDYGLEGVWGHAPTFHNVVEGAGPRIPYFLIGCRGWGGAGIPPPQYTIIIYY